MQERDAKYFHIQQLCFECSFVKKKVICSNKKSLGQIKIILGYHSSAQFKETHYYFQLWYFPSVCLD